MSSNHNNIPPALSQAFKRVFSPEDKTILESHYLECVKRVGLDLSDRGDISFNPRPSRLALIMIDDCGITSPKDILEGFESISSERLPTTSNDSLKPWFHADLLDRLRHAHLFLDKDETIQLISIARNNPSVGKISDKIKFILSKISDAD